MKQVSPKLVITAPHADVFGMQRFRDVLEQLPALANTPAGQNRRIVDIADSQALSFGPSSAQTLEALAVAIYAPGAA